MLSGLRARCRGPATGLEGGAAKKKDTGFYKYCGNSGLEGPCKFSAPGSEMRCTTGTGSTIRWKIFSERNWNMKPHICLTL